MLGYEIFEKKTGEGYEVISQIFGNIMERLCVLRIIRVRYKTKLYSALISDISCNYAGTRQFGDFGPSGSKSLVPIPNQKGQK